MEALWSGVENARGKCLCSLSGNWDPGLIGAVYPNIYMRYALSSHQVKMCCDSVGCPNMKSSHVIQGHFR